MGRDILEVLKNGAVDEKIVLLQSLIKSDGSQIDEQALEAIKALTTDSDIGLKFWAKKLFQRVAAKITPKPPPTPPESPTENKEISVDLLIQKLNASGESTFVSLDVIKKLCESGNTEAKQPLIDYLGRCQDVVQISFLTKQLGLCFPSEDLLPVLFPYLKHFDDRVISNSIEGIEGIGSPKCVAVFAQMLDHKSNRVRANAAKAIARFDKEKTVAVLTKMLQMRDKQHYVISACHAIKELKNDVFLPYLEPLLDDDLTFIDATKAIEAIGTQEALNVLKDAVDHSDDDDKKAIFAETIKRIENHLKGGSKSPAAVAKVGNHKSGSKSPAAVAKVGKGISTQQNELAKDGLPAFLDPIIAPIKDAFGVGKGHFLEAFLPIFRSTWKWAFRALGILVAIGFIYGAIWGVGKIQGMRPKAPEWLIGMTKTQREFVQALEDLNKTYQTTSSNLKRANCVDLRKQKLLGILNNEITFSDWVGEVEGIELVEDKGILSLRIKAPTINMFMGNIPIIESDKTIKIWTKSERVNTDGLIAKGTPLFKKISELEVGDKISFSGAFFRSEENFVAFLNTEKNETDSDRIIAKTFTHPFIPIKFSALELLEKKGK